VFIFKEKMSPSLTTFTFSFSNETTSVAVGIVDGSKAKEKSASVSDILQYGLVFPKSKFVKLAPNEACPKARMITKSEDCKRAGQQFYADDSITYCTAPTSCRFVQSADTWSSGTPIGCSWHTHPGGKLCYSDPSLLVHGENPMFKHDLKYPFESLCLAVPDNNTRPVLNKKIQFVYNADKGTITGTYNDGVAKLGVYNLSQTSFCPGYITLGITNWDWGKGHDVDSVQVHATANQTADRLREAQLQQSDLKQVKCKIDTHAAHTNLARHKKVTSNTCYAGCNSVNPQRAVDGNKYQTTGHPAWSTSGYDGGSGNPSKVLVCQCKNMAPMTMDGNPWDDPRYGKSACPTYVEGMQKPWLRVDMSAPVQITKMVIYNGRDNRRITKWSLQASPDPVNFVKVASGAAPENPNRSEQIIEAEFSAKVARYWRLVQEDPLSKQADGGVQGLHEFELYGHVCE